MTEGNELAHNQSLSVGEILLCEIKAHTGCIDSLRSGCVPAYMSMESHQKGLQTGKQNIFFDLSSEMCPHKMLNTHTTTVSNLAFPVVSTTEYVYSPHFIPLYPIPVAKDRQIV